MAPCFVAFDKRLEALQEELERTAPPPQPPRLQPNSCASEMPYGGAAKPPGMKQRSPAAKPGVTPDHVLRALAALTP
eukprot:10908618-Prorocentrum_lima.AAC.1